ncbi:uncharacterized protein METZ01_LOCUS162889, partial [marine metagenome]
MLSAGKLPIERKQRVGHDCYKERQWEASGTNCAHCSASEERAKQAADTKQNGKH